jgi:hypothetical protein
MNHIDTQLFVEEYASIAKDYGILYSDIKQTKSGDGIWRSMCRAEYL